MITNRCGNCRFFDKRGVPGFAGADGVCRRRAPTGPAIMAAPGRWSPFPPMRADDWCAEHSSEASS